MKAGHSLVCIASIVSSWLFKKFYLEIGWMDQSEAFINGEVSKDYTEMKTSFYSWYNIANSFNISTNDYSFEIAI